MDENKNVSEAIDALVKLHTNNVIANLFRYFVKLEEEFERFKVQFRSEQIIIGIVALLVNNLLLIWFITSSLKNGLEEKANVSSLYKVDDRVDVLRDTQERNFSNFTKDIHILRDRIQELEDTDISSLKEQF